MAYSDESLNRTRDIGLLYIMLNLLTATYVGTYTRPRNLANGLPSHSAPYLMIVMWVILVLFKLQCEVFDTIVVPVPVPVLCNLCPE